ncbi:hypothetical protein M0R45_020331 [Rubus argutus]|uniref:AIPP2-like SPOC-like domain-containing protein n=1 Tax=Rubus argutus TaxID=59490 RepID=A0AAW1X9U1_RUBAR
MDKPCDICAGFTDQGIAFKELIITCSKCRIAREHIYCVRVNHSLVEDWDPDNWVCESCEEGNGMLSPKSNIKEDTLESSAIRGHYDGMHSAGPRTSRNDSGWKAHPKRHKTIVNGNVRFISNEEVRRLSLANRPQLESSALGGHYDGMHSAGPSRSRNDSGWQDQSKRKTPIVNVKVRFISKEEVRRLSLADTSQRTAYGNKIVTRKSPVSWVKANRSIIRSEVARHDRPPMMPSISKINQQAYQNLKHSQADVFVPATDDDNSKKMEIATKKKSCTVSTLRSFSPISSPDAGTSKKMETATKKTVSTLRPFSPISNPSKQGIDLIIAISGKKDPGTPTKVHIIIEQPMDASVLSQRVETSSRVAVDEPNKFSRTPSTSRHSSLNMNYGGNTTAAEHNHSDEEERDLLNMFPSLHLYRSSLPALHATWKGGFIILDAETPAQFARGFQAQAPCTVHRKAYEFTRKMPPVLRANLLPRLLLWDDPFQDEPPDLHDVGLYFFPDDNIAGSRETYALLFEFMDTQNSAMRINFDRVEAVELLIFTSKQLHLDSLNTVTSTRTKNFLWGIFRDKNLCRADMDHIGTTFATEVDMVGGKMVGIVDLPKDSFSPCIIFRDKNHCRADMDDIGTTVATKVDMVGGKTLGIIDLSKDSANPCRRYL